jgi:hypothetical protein
LSASGEAVKIPSKIRAGDTVVWADLPTVDTFGAPVDGSTHGLTYFLRTNHNHQGATVAGVTVVGTPQGGGWTFTISSTTSAGFVADTWYWQAIATANAGGAKATLGSGSLVVEPSLSYTGQPGAFDGRSQAQKDLEAVQGAIRSLMSGGAVQEYRIGTRSLKRYELADLLTLESKLKADVARENKAAMIANGLGNPHNLYVRFGR